MLSQMRPKSARVHPNLSDIKRIWPNVGLHAEPLHGPCSGTTVDPQVTYTRRASGSSHASPSRRKDAASRDKASSGFSAPVLACQATMPGRTTTARGWKRCTRASALAASGASALRVARIMLRPRGARATREATRRARDERATSARRALPERAKSARGARGRRGDELRPKFGQVWQIVAKCQSPSIGRSWANFGEYGLDFVECSPRQC